MGEKKEKGEERRREKGEERKERERRGERGERKERKGRREKPGFTIQSYEGWSVCCPGCLLLEEGEKEKEREKERKKSRKEEEKKKTFFVQRSEKIESEKEKFKIGVYK